MTKPRTLDATQVIRPCHECGGTMQGTRQTYKYTECGLSNVRLHKVLVFECKCGVRVPEVPAISELHCLITLNLLKKPSLLSGEEVRFLRKVAGLSQKELAEIMGVTPTRPSKWENGSASKESDRLLRTICLLGMIQNMAAGKDTDKMKMLATKKFFHELNVRVVLKAIEDKSEGPKPVECENDPGATGEDAWFVPGSNPGRSELALQ